MKINIRIPDPVHSPLKPQKLGMGSDTLLIATGVAFIIFVPIVTLFLVQSEGKYFPKTKKEELPWARRKMFELESDREREAAARSQEPSKSNTHSVA
eukprot:g27054.t1